LHGGGLGKVGRIVHVLERGDEPVSLPALMHEGELEGSKVQLAVPSRF